ncbi:MAG: DUF5317 domain-containing protein [Actinomycetota bacterium]|nr:DUF5317 domain-containing protein [Actinomycetota bacterium]
MSFVLIVAAVCAGVAVLRGGSLRRLADTSFRHVWLLVTGAIISLAAAFWNPPWLGDVGALAVTIVVLVCAVVFLLANRDLPGIGIAGVGLAINTVVVLVNGAMPVSADAARIANARGSLSDPGLKHEVMGPETNLAWLADRIPLPGARIVLSAGDVVLAAGIGRLVYKRTLGAEGIGDSAVAKRKD